MVNFIKRNWVLFGFLVSFVLDGQYGILEKLLNNNDFWINIVRGLGVFFVAYFTKEKFGLTNLKDGEPDTDEGIGGGGIKNPPKP
jgi:hypothetical protein